jgi:hypothetical protein
MYVKCIDVGLLRRKGSVYVFDGEEKIDGLTKGNIYKVLSLKTDTSMSDNVDYYVVETDQGQVASYLKKRFTNLRKMKLERILNEKI